MIDTRTLPTHPPPTTSDALRNGIILQGLSGPLTAPWDGGPAMMIVFKHSAWLAPRL